MKHRSFDGVRVANVSIPFIGLDEQGNTTRSWAHIRMARDDGDINPRQVKRKIRHWARAELGRNLHHEDLHLVMKRVEYCVA